MKHRFAFLKVLFPISLMLSGSCGNCFELEKKDAIILYDAPETINIRKLLEERKGVIIVKRNNNFDNLLRNRHLDTTDKDKDLNIEGIESANYYFLKNNKVTKGTIISDGSEDNTNKTINKIADELNSQAYSSHSNSFEVSDKWELLTEQKFDWRMEYEGEWYGDYSEWGCHYKYEYNGVRYHLQTRESYITPGNDTNPDVSGLETTDFRSGALEYIMEKPEGLKSDFQLRDYAPKAQNPEWTETSGISGSFSFTVGSDGISMEATLGASFSYSCSSKSPNVLDYSNVYEDKLDIKFEYFDPFGTNDAQNFQYNTHTSMQLCMNVWKENIISPDDEGECIDRRAITMMKDCWWYWDDRTVTFNYGIKGML